MGGREHRQDWNPNSVHLSHFQSAKSKSCYMRNFRFLSYSFFFISDDLAHVFATKESSLNWINDASNYRDSSLTTNDCLCDAV
jgi:hypothetical protein